MVQSRECKITTNFWIHIDKSTQGIDIGWWAEYERSIWGVQNFVESMFGRDSIDSDTPRLLAGGAVGEIDRQDPVFHRGFDVLRLTNASQLTVSSKEGGERSNLPWYPLEA